MAKKKTQSAFFCQRCGVQSPKWLGKCPQCNEWNTFIEEIITKKKDNQIRFKNNKINNPILVNDIDYSNEKRIITNDKELNRVLGGGIVPGSLILLGGDPGIGKSTLLLQFALSSNRKKTLYISGEESEKQIKMRAERINKNSEHCYILTETSTQNIFQQIEKLQPDILVVDSIQTLHTTHIDSSPGSVSQIRECTVELMKYAKESGTAVFLIGHINKDGAIAGPKILEHMVDTVLQFRVEGKTSAHQTEGQRMVTARLNVKGWLEELKELTGRTDKEDLLFCMPDGSPMKDFPHMFQLLLEQADMRYNAAGQPRVLYSLRHMYATMRVRKGLSYHVLADQMGTSVEMIERHYSHVKNEEYAVPLAI